MGKASKVVQMFTNLRSNDQFRTVNEWFNAQKCRKGFQTNLNAKYIIISKENMMVKNFIKNFPTGGSNKIKNFPSSKIPK